jgi:hypothetical protein
MSALARGAESDPRVEKGRRPGLSPVRELRAVGRLPHSGNAMRIIEGAQDTVRVYFAGRKSRARGTTLRMASRVGLQCVVGSPARRELGSMETANAPLARRCFCCQAGAASQRQWAEWVQDAAFRAVPYRTRQVHTSLELNKAHFSRGNRRPPDWVNGRAFRGSMTRWRREKGTSCPIQ